MSEYYIEYKQDILRLYNLSQFEAQFNFRSADEFVKNLQINWNKFKKTERKPLKIPHSKKITRR